ncbi:MAG TPA: MCE family protein [Candidatus Omnitrophica bacterium]|nr:MCE family protein [Candidatus Omnitrophota bacterium]
MEYWRRSEWRLGVFISFGIVLFGALVFTISNINFFYKGYEVRALFRFASGIETGAPVRLAGVKVGEVKSVKIIYDPEDEAPLVEVDLIINSNVLIRQNANVLISTLGLLGEKYVEILPGDKSKPLLRDGDFIIGYDSIPIAKLSDLAYQIAQKLDKTIDSLKDIFSEEENRQNLKQTLSNVKILSANLNDLILETNKMAVRISNGDGTLGRLFSDDTLYEEILAIVRDIKRHPWKLIRKTRITEPDDDAGNRGYIYQR